MIKTAYAVAIAAIAASVFVAFPSLSPQVDASAPVVGAKGDRADIRFSKWGDFAQSLNRRVDLNHKSHHLGKPL